MSSKGRAKTFADRFLELKGDESYQSLSDRMAEAGIQLSPQGLHKYSQGGGITPESLMLLAKFFDCSPAELYFGIDNRSSTALPADVELLARALMVIPERFRPEIDRDILKIALAYVDKKTERTLHDKLERALAALK